jgi:hypothetical protein
LQAELDIHSSELPSAAPEATPEAPPIEAELSEPVLADDVGPGEQITFLTGTQP